MQWLLFKDFLSDWTGLSEDALHIYGALLVHLAAAALLRASLARFLPWLCVLAAIVINEALDVYLPGHPIEQWQIDGGIQDLWNTMLLPTLLWITARFTPHLVTGRPGRRAGAEASPEADGGERSVTPA